MIPPAIQTTSSALLAGGAEAAISAGTWEEKSVIVFEKEFFIGRLIATHNDPCFSLSGVVLLLNTLPTLALNFSETWVFLSPKLQ